MTQHLEILERKIRGVDILSSPRHIMDSYWKCFVKSNRTFGGKGNRSRHYKSDSRYSTRMTYCMCTSSVHGNTAASWSASPQSPPRFENSVVHGVCNT
jgi:hypothetical protein